MFVPPYEDPRVSFGFKEMYCDALYYDKDGTTDGKDCIAHSPRLTVFETLNKLLTPGPDGVLKVSVSQGATSGSSQALKMPNPSSWKLGLCQGQTFLS